MPLFTPPLLPPEEMVRIIRTGLPPSIRPQTVLIAGAGMAGLVSASLLKEAGHRVILLEASNRVGGRIYTIRTPFSDGLTFEAGAMRIPDIHYLVWEYIRKFRLPVNRFIITTPSDRIYVNGVLTRRRFYEQNPRILRFPLRPDEGDQTATQLFHSTVRQIVEGFYGRPGWQMELLRTLEPCSVQDVFQWPPFGRPLSQGAIDMIKVMLDTSGMMELSFLDVARFLLVLTDPTIRFYEISGGMDRLPAAFLPQLQEDLLLERKITGILPQKDQVTVEGVCTKTGERFHMTGDRLIVTLPFSVLRLVEVIPLTSFSYQKRKAIRELHYAAATKVGIEFTDRFWEENGERGGSTTTDLPIRFTFYPSDADPVDPAVITASYTWADESLTWTPLETPEATRVALRNMAAIYGPVVYEKYRRGISYNWSRSPYAAGGFSIFKPGQEAELSHAISAPEGRVHFAGEHTSQARMWIEGAIQSGIRVAKEVHDCNQ
ncbi:flavin monoamine oxidase family protein [Desmospora profundinema]|uniref:Monoamine oxidase n=1 Tax=Desmospora profundinema TaxID=1571184 RepID=A0ABU1IHU6_9BACL|nr:FAD-dependent oxidoreductase [Desmospora profundinema]MDR6224342.1 monoamine oxidase [Desmospora profundinema]